MGFRLPLVSLQSESGNMFILTKQTIFLYGSFCMGTDLIFWYQKITISRNSSFLGGNQSAPPPFGEGKNLPPRQNNPKTPGFLVVRKKWWRSIQNLTIQKKIGFVKMNMFPDSDCNETNGNRNPIAELIDLKTSLKKRVSKSLGLLAASFLRNGKPFVCHSLFRQAASLP